jgi:hypothetical protein
MSLRLPRSFALATLPFAVACGYGDHHHHDGYYYGDGYDYGAETGTIEQATIDVTDHELEPPPPGTGAGAFIEYESGGTYRVTTSCDSQGDCAWDIVVMPLGDAALKGASPVDLENSDSLTLGSNQAQLVAYTGREYDGFTVETDRGAGIRFDALLDGAPGNRFVYWIGDGALHSGAPSNPVDLVPDAE